MTTTANSGKLFNYLEKARALLKTAQSFEAQGNADAAATYYAKVEQLMRDYRIAEEDLIASGDPTAAIPVQVIVELCENGSPLYSNHAFLAQLVAEHVGARVALYRLHPEKKSPAVAFVGYESDVRVAIELLTAAQLVFSEKLEPKKDDSLSEAENIYRLRSSGITRWDVAVHMWGKEEGAKASAHAKVGRIYKEECARRGETPALDGKGIQLDVFRRAYAREFYWTLENRLRMARQHADREGRTMVLHGRRERVDEAFYQFYPSLRPKPATEVAEQKTGAKQSVKKYRGPTKSEERRSQREYGSAAARAGHRSGAAAAAQVELNRTASKVKRLDEPSATEARGAIEM